MSTGSYDEMMKNWMDTQKKMWDGFFETMQGSAKSPAAQSWEQMMTMGEEMYKKSSQAQAEWIQTWVNSLSSMQGAPAQVVDSAKQFQEMYQRWSDTQQQLWTNWFNMLKNFDPSKGMGASWMNLSPNPFQMWQETTRKMVDAQFDWMKSWMGQTRK